MTEFARWFGAVVLAMAMGWLGLALDGGFNKDEGHDHDEKIFDKRRAAPDFECDQGAVRHVGAEGLCMDAAID